MAEYETTIAHAQRLGDRDVAALSSLSDPHLVADLPFPIELVRDRFRALGLSAPHGALLSAAIAPGRLGAGWLPTAGAFAAAALAGLLLAARFDRSSLCSRCGHRICTRCEATVWSDELCEDCHHLFKNVSATDPKLRMARMQKLARRESRRSTLLDAASLIVPGVAGLAMRRPDVALLSLVFAAWIAAWWTWPEGLLADPMWIGELAPLAFAASAGAACAAYAAIVVRSLVARRNR